MEAPMVELEAPTEVVEASKIILSRACGFRVRVCRIFT